MGNYNIEKARKIARNVLKNAYAPYSNLNVAAVIVSSDGEYFFGVNVENVSYGLTVCAERNAVFNAVANGKREFSFLYLTSSYKEIITPCGACLQVLSEFCSPDMPILCEDLNGNSSSFSLKELFPMKFDF